jgi:alpha-glucosidase
LGRQASDAALLKVNDTIRKMFAYRHDILKALIGDGVTLVVLGRHERLADLPEYNRMKRIKGFDASARLLDYTPETKLLVVSEANVFGNPREPLAEECLAIRAFAKAIYYVCGTRPADPNWNNRGREVQQYELRVKRLDVQFGEKLKQLYDAAMTRKLWKGTLAVNDPVEYWAEGVVAYFNAKGHKAAPNGAPQPVATREALKEYDPDLYALVNETMTYDGHVDWRYSYLDTADDRP